MFHGELTELPKAVTRDGAISYPVQRRASIKDVLESLGVPHTEVYGIREDGRDVDFSLILAPGVRIDVYPATAPVDVSTPDPFHPQGYEAKRFIIDENVARLALFLRMLGYDAKYDRVYSDDEIAELAHSEKRILLSRDRGLLKRSKIIHGRLIRAAKPMDQLREVVEFYGLGDGGRDFLGRCLRCNVVLEDVEKAEIEHLLYPGPKKCHNNFKRCPKCGRIYWKGSHFRHMRDEVLGAGELDKYRRRVNNHLHKE